MNAARFVLVVGVAIAVILLASSPACAASIIFQDNFEDDDEESNLSEYQSKIAGAVTLYS